MEFLSVRNLYNLKTLFLLVSSVHIFISHVNFVELIALRTHVILFRFTLMSSGELFNVKIKQTY